MHIITHKRVLEFAAKQPESESGLEHWYRMMKRASIDSFDTLCSIFPSADKVGKLTVFNIGGNKARLIAAIHYNRRKVFIRHILIHEEYNKGKWKE
jgi:mRNA interferase HigB